MAMYVPTYWSAARGLWQVEEQGHGPIVLAISAWFLWAKRHQLVALEDRPDPWIGGAALALGILMYLGGRTFSVASLEFISQIVVVCGLLATIWDPLSTGRATAILLILVVGCAALWLFHRRMAAFAVAAPGMGPALATVGGMGVSAAPATGARVVPAPPRAASPVDDARADHAAPAGTLSDDDVRMLRRLAAALRDST